MMRFLCFFRPKAMPSAKRGFRVWHNTTICKEISNIYICNPSTILFYHTWHIKQDL